MILSTIDFGALPQLSLGTAAMLIFGAIASLAMLRGLMRILWGSIVLCSAGGAAFFAWQYAPTLLPEIIAKGPSYLPFAIPVAAFILVFLVLRFIGRFLVKPLGAPNTETAEKNRRSPFRWIVTLVFSLVPTSVICLAGATLLRHAGSVAEIKTYAESISKDPISKPAAFLVKIKQDLEEAIPAEWFAALDPSTSDIRVTLAKLISTVNDPPPKAVPILEVHDIRQIILKDPELRQLAAEGRYSDILRDPRLDKMLENPDLRQVLQGIEL